MSGGDCKPCADYWEARKDVLGPAMRTRLDVEDVFVMIDRYMSGVHRRHLAGLPIMPGLPPAPSSCEPDPQGSGAGGTP